MDLVAFTQMSRELDELELTRVVERFEEITSDVLDGSQSAAWDEAASVWSGHCDHIPAAADAPTPATRSPASGFRVRQPRV